MKRFSAICSVFVLGLSCAALFAAEAETRTWRSSKGKTIEGKLISANEKSVTIERADGKTVTMRLKRLSKEDRTWVGGYLAAEKEKKAGSVKKAEFKKLQGLLKKGLKARLKDEEKEELEELYFGLLPKTGADGEAVEWEIKYVNDDPGERDESDFIVLNMKTKGGGERLMWFHLFYYQDKKDIIIGRDKVGRFPAMRHGDKHAFAVIGMSEVRAIADHESYKDDKKIDKVILSFDIAAIEKL